MPGTPSEYLSDPNTRQAETVIDQLISEGAGGAVIIDALESAGLRVYNIEDIEEIPGEEDPGMESMEMMPEEMPEEGMGEGEYAGGHMYDDEVSALDSGPSMIGGDEGGNRDLIIEAVRFGVGEDKKRKSKSQKSK